MSGLSTHAVMALPAALILAAAGAAELTGRVTSVDSGDTFRMQADKGAFVVRLSDIGTPLGSAYYAPSSKQLLANMIQGYDVRVAVTAEAGERVFGHVYRGELDVNLELVKAGAAWWCMEFSSDSSYLPWQNQAQRKFGGLWSRTTDFDALLACRRDPPAAER